MVPAIRAVYYVTNLATWYAVEQSSMVTDIFVLYIRNIPGIFVYYLMRREER
jgi:hypothetical protein